MFDSNCSIYTTATYYSSAAVFASSLFESVKWNLHKDPSVYEHKLKLTELLKVHVS